MKICVYGAGAVGGTLGSMLANAEHEMTFIARGQHLRKMQEWGLQMVTPEGRQTIFGHYTNLMTTVQTPDYLLLCVKSYSLPEIEENVGRITGPNTVIIPVLNGIPWWHFYGIDGPLKNFVPKCLDPNGNLQKYFPLSNVVGGVVYMAAGVIEPGVIENKKHPPRFVVGEITNQNTPRLEKLGVMLTEAGFSRPVTQDIRAEIWLKLCWNIAFNTIAAITRMTALEIVEDKDTRPAAVTLMRELEQVALAAGINLKLDIEERVHVARKSGSHKPSMLQDVESGKPLETEAIVGAPLEIAAKLGVKCPIMEKLYVALKKLEQDNTNKMAS